MIEPRQLRIGNYYYNQVGRMDGEPSSTEVAQIKTGEEIDIWSFCMLPIPLTEEWLTKLGFKKGDLYYDLGKLNILAPNVYNPHWPKGRVYFNSWAILDCLPAHVHQLQNLYFALTGKELQLLSNSDKP